MMGATQIGICNSALIKLGAATISSITESSREAALCKALYEIVRDEVLRAHPWNFAMKRSTLYPTANTPAFEFDYEFDLPNDCLRVIGLEDPTIDYVVEGRTILCNDSEINLRYLYLNTDESSWDALFVSAFSWRLATELSLGLVQSAATTQAMIEGYKQALASARAVDGQESIIRNLVADEWLNARR